jgi:hypothetical protein
VQGRVARLAILVPGRDAVTDHAKRKRTARDAIGLVEAEQVTLDDRREASTPGVVHDVVEQDVARETDAQTKCLVIERNVERRQPRRVDERHEVRLRSPRVVGGGCVVEAKPQRPVAGDPPARQDVEDIAFLASESLDGIAEQRGDAHANGQDPGT